MASKFYKGTKPLLSQPYLGGGKLGRAYIGGQLAYGELPFVWTPQEINGITHWWRADKGVTLSGGTVTDWVDQISGKTLTQEGSSTAPDYVSSDTTMNNQPAIEFGNGGTTTDALSDQANRLSVGSTDFPFAWYVFSTSDNARGGYQIIGPDAGPDSSNQELAIEFNHPSYANTVSIYSYAVDSNGGVTIGDLTSRPDKGWVGFGVDNNDSLHPGYFYKNGEAIEAYSAGTYYWGERGNGIDLIVGNYGPSQTLGYVGRVLEFGFGTEEMDNDSKIDFHSYLNERYGLNFGILDVYTGASAAYSLRRLTINYTGDAIEVTRTSDSATQDIGFDSDGNLDESALTTFAGPNTCVVSKWYDQSGNNDHMTQTTQANMPTIVSSGTILKQDGKPIVRFDGSNDALTASSNNPFSFTGGASVVASVYKSATSYNTYETILSAGATGNSSNNNRDMKFFGFPNAGSVSPKPAIGTDIWSPSGVQVDASVSTDTRMLIGWYISNWSTHRSTGLSNITKDGVDQTTKAYGTNNPAAHNTNAMKMGVGDEILTPSFFSGDIQEVLVWNSDKNSDREGIQTQVNNYWEIY